MEERPVIGWIGLGKMGLPMSGHLVRSGFRVCGYDPDHANASLAAEQGVECLGSPGEVAGQAEIVISMIPNDAVLSAMVLDAGGLCEIMKPGQIFVDMSTVSPAISARVAASLSDGPTYLRAPVSGSTESAQSAQLTVIVSGPTDAFEDFLPIAEAMAARVCHVGEGEQSRYLKLVLNSLVSGSALLLSEAMTLGRAGGLSAATMMDVVCDSAVSSPLYKYKRQAVVEHDYAPAFTVSQMIKDTSLIDGAAQAAGLRMPVNDLVLQALGRAADAGFAENDFFVLVEGK